MRLLEVKIKKELKLSPVDDKFWKLSAPFYADFVTDEGTLELRLEPEWFTDLRSGCDVINRIAPKWGNPIYTAVVLFHDCAWSGLISRQLSNEILRQGMIMSGEVGSFRASLVYHAVQNFGTYYSMDDELPEPYTNNRVLEDIRWKDK